MAEQLTQDQVMALIQQQYPELIPILGQPGVRDALFTAVENTYSAPRLQAALQATPYYRNTPANERAWYILSTVDPATAAQQQKIARAKVDSIGLETGINQQFGPDQADALARDAAALGWTDAQIRQHVVDYNTGLAGGINATGGSYYTNLAAVTKAAQDYGVPLSQQAQTDWANRLTNGTVDSAAVQGYMIQQAKSLFPNDPNLAQALDSGQTVAQYADPYKQIAAKELNINPGDFNLSDPKWQAALSTVDPKTGVKTPMTLDQWQQTLRSDPKYGYDMTQNGQDQAAALTTALAQKMGAI